jgi:hypothetical protein
MEDKPVAVTATRKKEKKGNVPSQNLPPHEERAKRPVKVPRFGSLPSRFVRIDLHTRPYRTQFEIFN